MLKRLACIFGPKKSKYHNESTRMHNQWSRKDADKQSYTRLTDTTETAKHAQNTGYQIESDTNRSTQLQTPKNKGADQLTGSVADLRPCFLDIQNAGSLMTNVHVYVRPVKMPILAA